MSSVILDAMESADHISNVINHITKEKAEEIFHYKLKDMKILPCRSCGACGFKSPGKCVIKDDAHEILRAIANCNHIIMLTPIKFGGHSSCLKKVVDKFMNLSLPTYTVKKGHLLHPARYDVKNIIGIGVYEKNSKEQEESFKRLIENNAFNLQYPFKALTLESQGNIEEIKVKIDHLFMEVYS